jgi:hypothetical protein
MDDLLQGGVYISISSDRQRNQIPVEVAKEMIQEEIKPAASAPLV